VDCPDKGNEITVLPELLAMLDLKGCVVSLDAMGCQRAVADQIRKQKGDYVLMLKGNQGKLHTDTAEFFEAHEQSDPNFQEEDFEAQVYTHEEHVRGRHCRWKVVATSDLCPGLQPYRKKWPGLRSLVMIETWREQNGKHGHEKRFAITSLPANAPALADLVRGHWCVENNNHWMLDICFGEDHSRVRAGHSAKNLGTLRRLTLNAVKYAQTRMAAKRGVKRMLRMAAMDDEYLQKLLQIGLKAQPANSKPA
jgi:predicted transposase YbfD/YdcC